MAPGRYGSGNTSAAVLMACLYSFFRLRGNASGRSGHPRLTTFDPSPDRDNRPDTLHQPARPGALQKAVDRAQRTGHREAKNKVRRLLLQRVADQHRRDREQSKQGQGIHIKTSSIPAFASAFRTMVSEAMPALILPLPEAAAHWTPRGALVGLDLGTKPIGVAVSDPDRRLATGVTTIQRKTFTKDAAELLKIAGERACVGVVLGLPINMDGSEGPRAQSTRAFARNFAKLPDLAIGLWDARLSTAAVERELIAHDVRRARRAEVIDEHAAIFILQGALDRLAAFNRQNQS